YNEGKNLEKLIPYLFSIKIKNLSYIYVIDSNSSDDTQDIMNKYIRLYKNLIYIREERRNGKAYSLNKVLELIKDGIIIIHSADCYMDESSLNALIEKISGDVVAAMPLVEPILRYRNLAEKVSFFSWIISNETSKFLYQKGMLGHLGNDIIAIKRKAISFIDPLAINDDGYLALQLIKKGYRIALVEDAKSRIKATSSFIDYLNQRIRIDIGHKINKKLLGASSTTLKSIILVKPLIGSKILLITLRDYFPRSFIYIPLLILLELFVTVCSNLLSKFYRPIVWPIAYSTKDLFELEEDLLDKHGSCRMEK
ncbi:MAG TPA: glycosyltransferase, partial [Geobacterales bacterium]|nr:glycosyltransferase [Geobacterales bacterium]